MRSLGGLLLLAFACVACGGMTDEPPSPAGERCTDAECLPQGSECTPGEITGSSYCYLCTCLADGTWDCVEDCDTPLPDGTCTEGYRKSAGDGCNTCSCEDNAWVCTTEECPEPKCPMPDGESGPPCEEGVATLYGRADGTDACCELCASIEGYTYAPTMEVCEASKVCLPWQTRYAADGCSPCTCTQTGEWQCAHTDCNGEACGGPIARTCPEDQYCGYEANRFDCGLDGASSVCTTRPTECPTEAAPVCGCDGQTYDNACLANMAGTGVYTDQACPLIE